MLAQADRTRARRLRLGAGAGPQSVPDWRAGAWGLRAGGQGQGLKTPEFVN